MKTFFFLELGCCMFYKNTDILEICLKCGDLSKVCLGLPFNIQALIHKLSEKNNICLIRDQSMRGFTNIGDSQTLLL